MPATGLLAPARMLVAVRAIVPVTQMPPNRAEAMLARPWATSSMLERCLRPVMPSATLADSRLSTPPSRVKDAAEGSTLSSSARSTCGSRGVGRVWGMPPKRVPIVSIGSRSRAASTEAATTAISMAGQFGRARRRPKIRAAEPAPNARLAGLIVPIARPRTRSLGKKAPGSAPAR